MLLFAQLENVSPDHLRDWLLVLAGLVALVGGVIGIWTMLRPRPTEIGSQPLGVRVDGVVETSGARWSAGECISIHRTIAEHLKRHDCEIAALRADSKADTARVLAHVESVRTEIGAKMDGQAKEFGQALRDVPGQIIALLRNTGALRK